MSLKIELTALEARLIGCLIEKAITTPDQYPLSLNALVNACNQKSNREPLLSLSEREVQQTVDALGKKHLIMEKSGFGSRVPKYQHRFCNTEFGTLKLDPQELAIVCEMLVRGSQTPGELRTRASRMASFGETSEVEAALARLRDRPDGPYVVQLAREPGRRDSRWAHLFSGPVANVAVSTGADGEPEETQFAVPPEGSIPTPRNDDRLARVEQEVAALRAELEELKKRLGD